MLFVYVIFTNHQHPRLELTNQPTNQLTDRQNTPAVTHKPVVVSGKKINRTPACVAAMARKSASAPHAHSRWIHMDISSVSSGLRASERLAAAAATCGVDMATWNNMSTTCRAVHLMRSSIQHQLNNCPVPHAFDVDTIVSCCWLESFVFAKPCLSPPDGLVPVCQLTNCRRQTDRRL